MTLLLLLSFCFGLGFGRAQADRLTPVIGSTLMVGWPGTEIADASTQQLCQQLSRGEVGDVLFLRHNMKTADQVSQLTSYFARCGARFNPLLAVDQEGGLVDRIGNLPGEPSWPSAQEIGAHPRGYADAAYFPMAQRVAELGFNLNFGPVADLNTNPQNPVIGRLGRSYGTGNISGSLRAFTDAHEQVGVLTTLKHFPGHGSSRTDSHHGFTDITNSWSPAEAEAFAVVDQMPMTAIMMGHLVHRGFEVNGHPASLSEAFMDDLLRNHMDFDGVIVSDDMQMGAITDHYGFAQSVSPSLSAGLDLFIHSNSGPYRSDLVTAYHAAVRAALQDGTLSEADLRAKQRRINAWKP